VSSCDRARNLRIGTAGWAIPRAVADSFPAEGSGLERYAGRFDAAEINSSFHRAHRPATYERWADSTPAGFRFSAKIPKTITHQRRLVDADDELARFLEEVSGLGPKIGPLIVQLPPSLAFDEPTAARFFSAFRSRWTGPIACEPRHASWFGEPADELFTAHEVGADRGRSGPRARSRRARRLGRPALPAPARFAADLLLALRAGRDRGRRGPDRSGVRRNLVHVRQYGVRGGGRERARPRGGPASRG
jgi:uncharacterized protein YecE (DUF72 family)